MSIENYKSVPIDDIDKIPWNYKENDIVLAEKLKNNIINNGVIENLIIAKVDNSDRYSLINGNHRIDVLRDLNIKEAVCYDLGNISLSRAQRIAVETNETKFPVDSIKLSRLLQDISSNYAIEELEKTMPYSKEELDFFLDTSDADVKDLPEVSTDDFSSLDNGGAITVKKCPNCGVELN